MRLRPSPRRALAAPRPQHARSSRATALLAAGAVASLAACGGTAASDQPDGDGAGAGAGEDGLLVLAAFYPLQYVTDRVGGDLVTVESITPPGVEAHDVELSPSQLRTLGQADLVVHLADFQPAVDDAVESRGPERVLDVTEAADLREADEHTDEDEHADEEADEHADEETDEHSALDPHFWLDPMRLAAVGDAIAEALGEASPADAEAFQENADVLRADLEALDADLTQGLASCERDVVVTGHTAFGYLADRYGFTEVGIAGIDPDTEPSPARMREIGEVVREHGVTAVYTESVAAPAVAGALADDLGLEVLVLDPVETQVDEATDYRGVMELNLEALRTGLGCS
ncbi:metal ABC transporter substrate-binding protein [Cellulomonas carbonis]|uniref:ABC transporter substrate-binding protein n=1 Tax=Cellulomonas carbonis T26 TaxID=947969 RepID=A0A0A0BV83_9CELL|nr:metal ABC transporter substrate-binding protein [Cellulomonas carbonis]KGM11821.1 ABC transporter substrate-binding protein [Cellulomonas carbonis T26]GGB91937.1 zinc ABC transporter substrate-binding protein [Cellulomonas carbonis]